MDAQIWPVGENYVVVDRVPQRAKAVIAALGVSAQDQLTARILRWRAEDFLQEKEFCRLDDPFFEAPSHDAVRRTARQTHELPGGPLHPESGGPIPFDGVGAKGIFPDPHLKQFAVLANGHAGPTAADATMGLWPPPATPPPVDDASPWVTDPSVERLVTVIRDALADIHLDRFEAVASRWAAAFPDIGVQLAATLIIDLSALARRAQECGQELYCWSTP